MLNTKAIENKVASVIELTYSMGVESKTWFKDVEEFNRAASVGAILNNYRMRENVKALPVLVADSRRARNRELSYMSLEHLYNKLKSSNVSYVEIPEIGKLDKEGMVALREWLNTKLS